MANKASKTPTTKTTPSKADIQVLEPGPMFVTDLSDLPKSKRSQHTYEWLNSLPKGAIFTAKTLARAGVYKTPAVAASTIMRLHHAGLIERVQNDGKDVKGAYRRVD